MPAPRKFAEETRARGARLPGPGCAITASPSWLRAGTWGNCWTSTPRRCGTGSRPRSALCARPVRTNSADDTVELRRLRQEVAELRRANEILKACGGQKSGSGKIFVKA